MSGNMKSHIIGICGGSASGKTTLASELARMLTDTSCTLITMDNYYKDFVAQGIDPVNVNYDIPDSFDLKLLASHLTGLKMGVPVEGPVYNFDTHTRSRQKIMLSPTGIIMVEGLFLYNIREIASLIDLKIYIETEGEIRFRRRMKRDVSERGRTPKSVIDQFEKSVQPMHEIYVKPNKVLADFVIPGDDPKETDMHILLDEVRKFFRKKTVK